MHIVNHVHLPTLRIGGELRLIAADRARGITGFEVWMRTLEPGADTALARQRPRRQPSERGPQARPSPTNGLAQRARGDGSFGRCGATACSEYCLPCRDEGGIHT